MHNKNKSFDSAKNFKSSIIRLISELKGYKILIIISLVLACLGSILSIIAPDKLSKLTDEISKGLVINTDNLEELSTTMQKNFQNEEFGSKVFNILNLNLNQDTINTVMTSSTISTEDKEILKEIITNLSNNNYEPILNDLGKLKEDTYHIILSDTIYEGIAISVNDKIMLIKLIYNMTNNLSSNDINLSSNLNQILFTDIKIDKTVITGSEIGEYINIMSSVDSSNTTDIYAKISKLPQSIQDILEPTMNMKNIKNIVIFLVCLYVISALFTYIQSISMTHVANVFANKLRTMISTKINKLPLKYFDNHVIGDVLSRVVNDVDTIAQSMNQSLATLVSATTLFLGTIIMMFYTNWIMALTAIISSLFGFIFMVSILGKSQKHFIARQEELGNLNGHIEEIYSGLNVVKAYNGKIAADKKFDEYNKKVYDANRKSQFLSGLMMPMMGFIGNFGYVAVCIVGAILAMNNNISFGVIIAFITYVRLFTSPLSQIAQAMTSMQSTAAASERVFEFLDEEEMKEEDNLTKSLDKNKVKGKIEFQNVVFKYDSNDNPTINNFSAKAMPGQKIAIVGPTGAGKTTMVNLLMKFYDINSGDIKIDGVSIKELKRSNIHDLFTMVLQDTWLFNGTIKENIIYNRENISDDEVKHVCEVVGLDHYIRTLPNGYDSTLNDNDSVSAGQRQLLTIARGMIKDAPFLILDEATSNVDTRTEVLVQNAMDKLTIGKTSFIIAHRLSTIKNADLILVMKDGNIIETGNHDQLIKKNGFYAELYNSQFEL